MVKEEVLESSIFSLGALVIFAAFLPGVLGYGLILLLLGDSSLVPTNMVSALAIIFMIGFISNFFGHAFGILQRKLLFKENYPAKIFQLSYNLDKELAVRVRKDIDYWFSYYCWYWNSAIAILIALFIKIFFSLYNSQEYAYTNAELYLSIFLVITAILLILISNKILRDVQTILQDLIFKNNSCENKK